jgi:hypothetical protein
LVIAYEYQKYRKETGKKWREKTRQKVGKNPGTEKRE